LPGFGSTPGWSGMREPGGVPHKALGIAYGVHGSGRSEVVGIYSNDAALIRLAGALPAEQNEWLRATFPPGGVASLGARSREHGGDAGGGGTADGLRMPRTAADDQGLAPRVGTLTL